MTITQQLRLDSQQRVSTRSIDTVHAQVHAGNFYTVSKLIQAVAASGTLDIFIINGANYDLHSAFSAAAGGDAYFRIYEGTTVAGNGTALSAINNLRSSSNTSEASFFHTPTVSGVGSLLYEDYIPGGGVFGSGGSDGGPIRAGTELDLAINTNYLIRLTNATAGAQDLSIGMGFYELAI